MFDDRRLTMDFRLFDLQEGLVELVSTINELKEEDQKELIDILDCHFDPEKKPILPNIKRSNNRSKRRKLQLQFSLS